MICEWMICEWMMSEKAVTMGRMILYVVSIEIKVTAGLDGAYLGS